MSRILFLMSLIIHQAAFGLEIDLPSGETIELERHDAAIRIDGVLDETVWSGLDQFDEFVVVEPDTLVDPEYQTLVSLFFNERGLYVGVWVKQPPETRVARLSSRDNRDIKRDYMGMVLDTSGEGRYGYWFGVALGDSQMDGTLLPEKQFSSDWDGAWSGATSETDTGWIAEMFIPWGIVSMPKTSGPRRIGFYMERFVAHRDELWSWPAL
ncbi:MAG: hypothetical protein ACPG4A_05630, partial [Pseudomonadales bacterium]